MNILGISAFYHDSAAALIVDGDIVAAAQEERFTRKRHDAAFPRNAVAYCLEEAGLTADQLDYIAVYDKPMLKFERLLETQLAFAPSGLRSFVMATPVWLREKLMMRRMISRRPPSKHEGSSVVHGPSRKSCRECIFSSPFDEAAILTLDGVGEWTTSSWGIGRGSKIEMKGHLEFPHSPGLLYSAFTYYCGFKVNSGEYKLMGLAPCGTPVYAELIYRNLIDLKPDGSFWLNMDYFNTSFSQAVWPSTALPTANFCVRVLLTTSGSSRLPAMPAEHSELPCSPGINSSINPGALRRIARANRLRKPRGILPHVTVDRTSHPRTPAPACAGICEGSSSGLCTGAPRPRDAAH